MDALQRLVAEAESEGVTAYRCRVHVDQEIQKWRRGVGEGRHRVMLTDDDPYAYVAPWRLPVQRRLGVCGQLGGPCENARTLPGLGR